MDVTNLAWVRLFRRDERGATAIEYGLIVGIMSIAVVGIMATGGALDGVYQDISEIVTAIGDGGGEDGG